MRTEDTEITIPTITMDHCLPSQSEETSLILLVIKDTRSKAVHAMIVPHTEHDEWVINVILRCIDGYGHGRIVLDKGTPKCCLLGKVSAIRQRWATARNGVGELQKEVTVHPMELSRVPCDTRKG